MNAESAPGSQVERVVARVSRFLEWSCILFLFVQVVIVVYVVFGRFILNRTPRWGEEVALIAMVWLSMFSAVLAEIQDQHISIDLVDILLPPLVKRIRTVAFNILNACFSLFLVVEGVKLAHLTRQSIMPGSRLPMPALYLSVPAASVFLTLVLAKKIVSKG